MSIFADREKAAERKFEQEQEFAFRLRARRNKLVGLWAAAKMGLTGAAASRYALELVDEITQHGDAPIIKKVFADLVAHGIPATEAEITQHLAASAARARRDLGDA